VIKVLLGTLMRTLGRGNAVHDARALLPWDVNGTLGPGERGEVAAWLGADDAARAEAAALAEIRAAVAEQPQHAPPPAVLRRALARVRDAEVRPAPRAAWARGALVAVVTTVGLWLAVQPGVALQWSARGPADVVYRIYRAPVGTEAFDLVDEVRGRPEADSYRLVDSHVPPGRHTYRVEAVAAGRSVGRSEAITADGWAVLLTQLAVAASGISTGWVLAKSKSEHRIQRGFS